MFQRNGNTKCLDKEKVGEDNVFHLGNKRECVIVDIEEDGSMDVYPDDELVEITPQNIRIRKVILDKVEERRKKSQN